MSAALRMAVEVPELLRVRPRDPRGYPIPFVVWSDGQRPHFQINDERRVRSCINRRLCALCGRRMWDGFWFVGGERCFTDPRGAFIDPPAHEACARYAMQVCPFLAAPSYAKRIDDGTVREVPRDAVLVKEAAMPDRRPDLFGLGHAADYRVIEPQRYLRPTGWITVEYWREGARIG